MTVVGVTFSMVLVTLALASSQYTSRILRNFTQDRVTQVVLGIFAGIFTYCLICCAPYARRRGQIYSKPGRVFRRRAGDRRHRRSHFLHPSHRASIQASSIIASVANETMGAIDRLFPGNLDKNLLLTMRISHRSLYRTEMAGSPGQSEWLHPKRG